MITPDLPLNRDEAQRYVSETAKTLGGGPQPCGHLACQKDSFKKSLESSRILAYAPYEEKPLAVSSVKKGKKKKKNQRGEDRLGGSPRRGYALVLDDSVFFPEGGGQPSDTGRIVLNVSNGDTELSVSDVQNVGGICVLSCTAPSNGEDLLLEALRDALDGGASIVRQVLDWDRRFDFMTQHSAQHLVSAVALDEEDLKTNSFSLQREALISYIDFGVDPEVDIERHRDAIRRVENSANELICQNLSMTPKYLSLDDPEFKSKVRRKVVADLREMHVDTMVKLGNS